MSVVEVPKGTLQLPLTINESHSSVTLALSVANVESDIVTIRIPRKSAYAFRPGDHLYLTLATATPTSITSGTIKVYIADANKVTKIAVIDSTPISAFAELTDETKKFRFKSGFARGEDEYIIVTFKGAAVAATAQTKLMLTGMQVIEQ